MASPIIWLPLTGSTENRGTDSINVNTRGIEYVNDGLIGPCPYFDGDSNKYISIPDARTQYDNFTWSVWIYVSTEDYNTWNSAETKQHAYILSQGRDCGIFGVSIILTSSGHIASLRGDSTSCNYIYTVELSTILDEWHNIILVVSSTGNEMYIDGELANSSTEYIEPDYSQADGGLVIGKMSYGYTGTTTYFPWIGKIADVRIFDKVLSIKEIRELNKELMIHYKLDSKEDECKVNINPNVDPVGWGTFSNSKRYSGDDGVYHNFLYNNIAKDSTNLWGNVEYTPYPYTPNHYYHYGLDIKLNAAISKTGIAIDFRGARTANDYHPGYKNERVRDTDAGEGWKHYTTYALVPETLQNSSGTELTVSPRIELYSANLAWAVTDDAETGPRHIDIDIRHPMVLDLGETLPTDWANYDYIPSGVDNSYVYDSSGFGNDLEYGSGYFNLVDGGIHFDDSCYYNLKNPWWYNGVGSTAISQFTITFWIYKTDYEDYNIVFGTGSSPTANLWISICTEKDAIWVYYHGNKYMSTVSGVDTTDRFTYDEWHHCAVIFNSSNTKTYLDGVLISDVTIDGLNTIGFNTEYMNIGNAYTGTSWSGCKTTMTLKDFRMYARALTQDDIIEMMKDMVQVDNKENIYADEMIDSSEDPNPNLFDIPNYLVNPSGTGMHCTYTTLYRGNDPYGIQLYPVSTDTSRDMYLYGSVTSTYEEGVGRPDSSVWRVMFRVKPSTTYKFTIECDRVGTMTHSKCYYRCFDNKMTAIGTTFTALTSDTPPYMITTPENAYYIYFRIGQSFSVNTMTSTVVTFTDISFKEVKTSTNPSQSVNNDGTLTGAFDENNLNLPDDMEIREFNGCTWARIFHHNPRGGQVMFTNKEEAKDCQLLYKYSRLNLITDDLRGDDGKFEFLYENPVDNPGRYTQWKQTFNPMSGIVTSDDGATFTAVDGLEVISNNLSNSFYGMNLSNTDHTLLDMCPGHGNWFWAIGCVRIGYENPDDGGEITGYVPGPRSPVPTGVGTMLLSPIDLWIRIDNIPRTKGAQIYADKITATEFEEK